MAFVEKYYIEHTSPAGVGFRVSIKKDGFSGDARRLYLEYNGIKIDHKHDDWFEPIIGQSATLSIINDASNWYDLEDLATLDEREFRITIDASYDDASICLFDGWINSDIVTQNYLNKSIIDLTASNYVSKLEDVHPTMVDNTPEVRSFIDILNETIRLTGKTDNIRVRNFLDPSGGILTPQKTCFNICGCNTENFWENNIDRLGGTQIIEEILKPFDTYLYWWNGKWYLERYADIWVNDGSKAYVEYSTDASYNYLGKGTAITVSETSTALPVATSSNSLAFLNGTQSISMIPGLKYLEINTKLDSYLNMINPDLSRVQGYDAHAMYMYPPLRGWYAFQSVYQPGTYDIDYPGYHYGGFMMENVSTGYMLTTEPTFFGPWQYPGMRFATIGNAIYRLGWPIWRDGTGAQVGSALYNYHSLSTRFRTTITRKVDSSVGGDGTVLNVKWKFGSPYPGAGGVAAWDHRLFYFVRIAPGQRFIRYDQTGNYWKYTTSIIDGSSYIDVPGSDFNPDTAVCEVSVDIPIGDVSGWTSVGGLGSGDFDIVFGLMGELMSPTGTDNYYASPLFAWYGDFQITGNADLQDNRWTGTLDSNTLNKKSVDLRIFDVDDLNYRNGILTGPNLDERTTYWCEYDGSKGYPLVKWLIHDRFQLYNRNRRKIQGSLRYPGFLKPMSMWYDSYDPSQRQYLLTSYTYNVGDDEYKCTFLEYDNTEDVNIGAWVEMYPEAEPSTGTAWVSIDTNGNIISNQLGDLMIDLSILGFANAYAIENEGFYDNYSAYGQTKYEYGVELLQSQELAYADADPVRPEPDAEAWENVDASGWGSNVGISDGSIHRLTFYGTDYAAYQTGEQMSSGWAKIFPKFSGTNIDVSVINNKIEWDYNHVITVSYEDPSIK